MAAEVGGMTDERCDVCGYGWNARDCDNPAGPCGCGAWHHHRCHADGEDIGPEHKCLQHAEEAPSTDERQACQTCFCAEGEHVLWDDYGPRCLGCGSAGGDEFHPFEPPPEAAPSTDKEEARWERRHSTGGRVWWRSPEGGYVLVDESLEAAIRAPLEAEVERLREALDAIGWHVSPESPIGRIVHGALATPPSSTEGTDTLKANFDGCPFCGGDESIGVHTAGRCEGTKEVEG